jgi:hypothetical protein
MLVGDSVMVAVTETCKLAGPYPGADAVMIAAPILSPVTCGCASGAVKPAGTNTLLGVIVTVDGSLLLKLITTPPAGAGVPNVTGNAADCPNPTDTLPDSVIVPGATTVKLTASSKMFGGAPTWIVVEPADNPVTGTTTLLALAGIITLPGTLATAALSELTVNVSTDGTGAPSPSIRLNVVPRWMVSLAGPTRIPDTRTVWVLPVIPNALALISACP